MSATLKLPSTIIFIALFLLVLIAFIYPRPIFAQIVEHPDIDSQMLSLVWHKGGSINNVYANGNYLYAATPVSLQIFDVSNKSLPVLLGEMILPAGPADIVVKGNYAYVANGEAGLQIIDVTNPYTPSPISTFNTSGSVSALYLAGNYIYAADSVDGLQIIDISSPLSPSLKGGYLPSGNIVDIFVSGNYAYLAENDKGLEIINVSNPAAPIFTSRINDLNYADNVISVSVKSNWAYLANGNKGFTVIDITNPAAPGDMVNIKTTGANGQPVYRKSVVVSLDNILYITGGNGIDAFNISNPLLPSLLGSSANIAGNANINILSNYIYVAAGGEGLQIVDRTFNYLPIIGSYDDTFSWGESFVQGNNLYIARGNLLIYDITNPSAPLEKSNFASSEIWDMWVAGDYAYTTGGGNYYDANIINISNPVSPVIEGTFSVGSGRDIQVQGNYAYVAAEYTSLKIFDVSNPGAPGFVGSFDDYGGYYSVFVSGNYAYISDGSFLQIVDVSDPTAPSSRGIFNLNGGWTYDVFVQGNYAYVADFNDPGLKIIDVSNPSSPALSGNFPMNTGPYSWSGGIYRKDIYVTGNYAYVAEGDLFVIDISNPSSPLLADKYSPVTGGDTFVSGNYVFVADWYGGFFILSMNENQTNNPPTATIDSILPNPATQGQNVNFSSHGTDSDGTIVAYNWRSSLDGQLSTQASFNNSNLSVGTHTIYFKVQDNDGAWSQEVSTILTVNPLPQWNFSVTKVWDSGAGNWDWSATKLVAGDFNGDGSDDMAALYEFPAQRQARMFVWLSDGVGGFSPPQPWWDSGASNWDGAGAQLTSGDFDGDGLSDLAVLYNFFAQRQAKAFVFVSNGGGFDNTGAWWDSGASNWDGAGAQLTSGDFDGDGASDLAVLYNFFAQRQAKALVFISNGAGFDNPGVWWDSGAGNWDGAGAQLAAGDFDGDGASDLAVLYNFFAQRQAKALVFISNDAGFDNPGVWWDSGAGNWDGAGAQLAAGDFDGDGFGDLLTFYSYSGDQARIFIFTSAGNQFNNSVMWWDSGAGNWNGGATRIYAGDFVGLDGIDEPLGFYGYGGSQSAFFLFD